VLPDWETDSGIESADALPLWDKTTFKPPARTRQHVRRGTKTWTRQRDAQALTQAVFACARPSTPAPCDADAIAAWTAPDPEDGNHPPWRRGPSPTERVRSASIDKSVRARDAAGVGMRGKREPKNVAMNCGGEEHFAVLTVRQDAVETTSAPQ